MKFILLFFGLAFIFILCMYCLQRGRQKRIGLLGVVLIMIFCTPFFGFFIVESLANHKRPCSWCGNAENEADHCGLCGKNEQGGISQTFKNRHQ
jgi:hypothetical protein